MKILKVVGGVLPVGEGERLFLSAAQIASRRHMLRDVGDGKDFAFCVAARVLQFKTGEVLGVVAVAKPHLDMVEDAAAGAGKAMAKAAASAEAAIEAAERKAERERRAAEAEAKAKAEAEAKAKAEAEAKAAGNQT
jgi:hypothetical protein